MAEACQRRQNAGRQRDLRRSASKFQDAYDVSRSFDNDDPRRVKVHIIWHTRATSNKSR
jgi:hypothetical protein